MSAPTTLPAMIELLTRKHPDRPIVSIRTLAEYLLAEQKKQLKESSNR